MSFYDAIRVGASGAADFEVERSLRFNDGDSAHLSRTPSSAGNRKTFTWSAWIKRGELGATQGRCFGGGVSGSDYFEIYFPSDDGLRVIWYQGGQTLTTTTAKFRDPSAWYHFVVAVDTTQSTAGDRIKMYRNNVLLERDSTNPSQNLDTSVNNTVEHNIGKYLTGNASYFDGYMAEINFVDGSALTPSSFAETNAETGQWVPINTSGLTFGTNGFRLNFSDNSGTTATTLGKDTSGNGNNFTPNNFSVSAGIGNDSLTDTPTNNFCTLNPLKTLGTYALSNGNLTVSGSARFDSVGTFAVSSGKWFWEITNTDVGVAYNGILNINQFRGAAGQIGTGGVYTQYVYDGTKYRDANPSGASSYGASYTDGDIVGVALNLDDNEITFYKNGASQGAITIPNDLYAAYLYSDSGNYNYSINFGQRAFSYTVPTGYKSLNSANLPDPTILLPNKHFGTILYTGNNTDDRDITDSSAVDFTPDWLWIKERSGTESHLLFNSVVGTSDFLKSNSTAAQGNDPNALQAFNSNGFQIGTSSELNANSETYVAWNWNAGDTDSATYRVVVVSDSGNKYRFRNSANTATFAQSAVTLDLAEGGTYTFDGSDSTMASHPIKLSTTANGTHGGGSSYNTGVTYELDGATVTESAYVSGYSSATSRKLIITVAASAPTLYYYCHVHSGMGGQINTNSTLGSSNFDGSIQTTVKANTTAGFSIVSYSGNGTDNATVGHGLGVKPDTIIIKLRTGDTNWMIYHNRINQGVDPEDYHTEFSVQGVVNALTPLNDTAPTTSVVNLKGGNEANKSGGTHIMYCFNGVKGYSKFGGYIGNGNADGPFVFTGFTPALIFLKNVSVNNNWCIKTAKISTFNRADAALQANTNSAEQASFGSIDFLSNGFKLRNAGGSTNGNGNNFIYFAFAESPFKNSRAR